MRHYNKRFEYLFATIVEIQHHKIFKTKTIKFRKMFHDEICTHKVSMDKLNRVNCYNKIREGGSYIIKIDSYEIIGLNGKRETHHLWSYKCLPARDRNMLEKAFILFTDTKDIQLALHRSGIVEYCKLLDNAKLIQKQENLQQELLGIEND